MADVMTDMVYMVHGASGGGASFPDEDGVIEWYEAHGWEKADEPKQAVFVPDPGTTDENPWVTLYHPELKTTHEFPNNFEAISGAGEAGWEIPPEDSPEDPPPASEKASTAQAATSNETE